ncbi:MAG: M20 family metallopeptidase [Planctomycetota bacterium]
MPLKPTDAADAARLARRLIRPVRDDIITLLRRLVRTKSVAVPPNGNEAPAQKILADFLKRRGVKARLYDTTFLNKSRHRLVRRERNYKGRPNLIASVKGTGGGKSLLFSGHIDTVPAPGKWRDDPFSGAIRGGRLYGRGAWDMKSGLAAHFGVLLALAKARRRRHARRTPQGHHRRRLHHHRMQWPQHRARVARGFLSRHNRPRRRPVRVFLEGGGRKSRDPGRPASRLGRRLAKAPPRGRPPPDLQGFPGPGAGPGPRCRGQPL